MSDKTPSPQSVVVPVEPTLATFDTPDFAARTHAPHMESWAYNQMPKAGWSDLKLFQYDGTDLYQWFGKKTGSVFEDAEGEPFTIKPAAPAPSSLAGGEDWKNDVEWLRECSRYFLKRDTKGEDSAFWSNIRNSENATRIADRLAALSPEAPARVGGDALVAHFKAMQRMATAYLVPEDYRDRDGRVTLHGTHTNTEQWKQGQRGARAEAFANDMIYMLDGPEARSALTPRHEAPAEGAGEIERLAAVIADFCPKHASPVPHDWMRNAASDFLRARSSAPEARDGEQPHCQLCGGTVEGWFCQTCEASFEEVDGLLVIKSEATHPAAPSADKLRIAMDAFDAITDLSTALRNGGPDSSDLQDLSDNLNTAVDLAHEALAALKGDAKWAI